MDKLSRYRRIIAQILEQQAAYGSSFGQIDEYAICDEKTDNYLLLNVGWHPNGRRQQGVPVHIRIKNGKVWLEWDGTDQEIARQLLDAGIAKEDLVFPKFKTAKTAEAELVAA